ncbi:MAG: DHHA1 domain-containing protein [Acidobacteria bacterium]|jgi:alanyl-tRNA synthetase|nr:DHHA1 domain-containing protein [Acidobacteriota bacterium]
MTEKLYYQNTNQTEFEAHVIEIVNNKNTWQIILDKTCFFPESGGQPADKGWLNEIPVLDVRKEGDKIIHFLPEKPAQVNEIVKGKINPDWRKDFMQQHTGQHIISGALWTVGKYKTVSVHMGLDYTTVEIETPEIPEHDLMEAEKLANRVITSDMVLQFIEAGQDELENYNLRRPTNREGKIRLVKIGDFDCSACGGLHLDSTRSVGLIKAIGTEKIRGNTRIAWKIGDRAYDDYRKKDKIIAGLKSILSTNEDMIIEKIKELIEDTGAIKRKYNMIENRLAEIMAQDLYNTQRLSISNTHVITASWNAEEDELVKKIMKNLLKNEKILVCLVNSVAGKIQWSIGCSEDIAFQFNEIKDKLLPIIEGKGGGRHPLWQGTGLNPNGAAEFLEKFKMLKI